MTRKEASEIIFNYIKSIGFEPIKIQYGDCYFIFDKGEDGVVWFKIKGITKWKFAMWIDTDKENLKNEDEKKSDYPALQFFCQYEDNIDKFKPSRSHFLAKYELRELENPAKYQWYQIKEILLTIKRHPFLSYCLDNGGYTSEYFIYEYFKDRIVSRKNKIENYFKIWLPYIYAKSKIKLFKNNPIIQNVKIIDGCHDGWITSPRWTLDILFKENSTEEKEIDFLNKWFKKDDYGQLRLEYGRVGIKEIYYYSHEEKSKSN